MIYLTENLSVNYLHYMQFKTLVNIDTVIHRC